MSKSTLQTMIEYAGFETRSYSGRSMYGKECLAVTSDEAAPEVLTLLFEEVIMKHPSEEEKEAFAEALRGFKTDSMGRGTVIYWPNVKYVENEDEEDEESDDDE